ncbi:MAG: squalene/phytoene synthase family protein, partial [Verrucomicrobiota bacterium]
LKNLAQFRERILGTTNVALDFGELANQQSLPAEKILLERCEDALKILAQFSREDQMRIRDVLKIIISGQELDLQRFASANEKSIVALQNDSELDDYTYRVAGCVGEFWTKMCRTHLFPHGLDDKFLIENGIRFGKGLQLVNILRDLPRDLRQGRCYLPAEKLAELGLRPIDLLQPEMESRLRPIYTHYLNSAEAHLVAGWNYTNLIPRGQIRLRLACAWPILIGIRTLNKLRAENPLDSSRHVKITRSEVRQIVFASLWKIPFSPAWKRQFPADR